MASSAAPDSAVDRSGGASPPAADPLAARSVSPDPQGGAEPILCGHCGRTASNGISCEGMCVADSGY